MDEADARKTNQAVDTSDDAGKNNGNDQQEVSPKVHGSLDRSKTDREQVGGKDPLQYGIHKLAIVLKCRCGRIVINVNRKDVRDAMAGGKMLNVCNGCGAKNITISFDIDPVNLGINPAKIIV